MKTKRSAFTKWLIALAGVVALVSALLLTFQDTITDTVMHRLVTERLQGVRHNDFDGTLSVILCGAGSPLQDPERSGPCALVIAGDHVMLVDAGNGVSNIPAMALQTGRVDSVFLTHFHSDHINGLGELMTQRWAGSGSSNPLPVYGPLGVAPVVDGFNQAYKADRHYRVAHHGASVMPATGGLAEARTIDWMNSGESHVVYEQQGLKVTAFAVNHSPVEPAVGYRFDYQGRSLVFSGDTVALPATARMAENADVLIHEALSAPLVNLITRAARESGEKRVEKITLDILDYHTAPLEAARLAQTAGTGVLLYHHVVPQLPTYNLRKRFLAGVEDAYDGDVYIGRDGTFISVALEDGRIRQGNLLD